MYFALLLLPFLSASTFAVSCNIDTNSSSDSSSSTYPNKSQIKSIFYTLNTNSSIFFDHVVDDVDWTVEGTHPLAGHYTSKEVFQKSTLLRLEETMKPPLGKPAKIKVKNVVGGGDEEWSVTEFKNLGKCVNGLIFKNDYAWSTRWNKDCKIVEVRAYLDSVLVTQAIVENEVPSYHSGDERTKAEEEFLPVAKGVTATMAAS